METMPFADDSYERGIHHIQLLVFR
jgi:hypothetical protein